MNEGLNEAQVAMKRRAERESLAGRREVRRGRPWHLAPWDAFAPSSSFPPTARRITRRETGDAEWTGSRFTAAALRHLTAWWAGEPADADTGYSHLSAYRLLHLL